MTKNKNKTDKYRDLLVLILMPAAALMVCWFLKADYLFSSLLCFGLPVVYLSFRKPKSIKRAAIFSFIFGLVGGFLFDYFGTLDNAWHVPTIFPFRILGVVPVEDMVWALLVTYFSIMFYENFFDKRPHKLLGKRMPYLCSLFCGSLFIVLIALATYGHVMMIRYFYFRGSLILCGIPILIFYFFWPKYLSPVLKMFPYFFLLGLFYEILGLHYGYWAFTGTQYIGWVTIGSYRFPIEELGFWVVLWNAISIAYFEFFDDNNVSLKNPPLLARFKAFSNK